MASLFYNNGKSTLLNGQLDWDDAGSTTIRIMLVYSGYTPDPDHNYVSDITNEATGTGYTRKDLTGRSINKNDTTDKVYGDASDVTWTGLDCGTIAGAVVYKQIGGDDSTPADDPIIVYMDYADLVTNGGDVTLSWHVSGLFSF